MENLLNTYEVAKHLRMSEQQIRKYCREGKLRCYKPDRKILIPESAIDDFLKGRFTK